MKKAIIVLVLILVKVSLFAQEKVQHDTIIYEFGEIKEILIPVERKRVFIDKVTYTFNDEALAKARYAKDLLNSLPELRVDQISNTIVSTKGGTTLILINGIEASDLQTRSIKPEQVVRVEYFDIPPARWANRADQVVNIITRNPENGYVFGIDGGSALTTGFVNGSAYANVTRGKNNFGLEYTIYFRDYKDRTSVNSYEYNLNDTQYITQDKRNEKFGYTDQSVAVRYTNVETDKYAFQAKLDLNINTSFAYANGVSLYVQNDVIDDHSIYKHSNTNYLKPTLDLYYSRKFNGKDELSVNLVGSFFTTKNKDNIREWNTTTAQEKYNYLTILDADQKGFVAEVSHSHQFEKGKLTSGYRISHNSIDNNLINLNGVSNNTVKYLEQYIYSEFSGKTDYLMYRLGMGMTNVNNKNEDANTNTWTVTPTLVLGYELTPSQSLRFTSSYKPLSPSNAALSSNVVQIVQNIVQTGNPYLKVQKSFANKFIYSFKSSYFDLNLAAFYRYTKDPYNQLYLENTEGDALIGYKLTYENAQNSQQYGMQLTGSVRPFESDILVLKINLTPASERFKTSDNRVLKNDYIGNYFIVSSVYNKFSIEYQFNIPYYTLEGAQLYSQENTSDLFLSYKQKNWKFTTGIYWLGMPSTYKQHTIDKQYVNYSRVGKIWDNKNMFILGISYDFTTGKKTNINRKLENETGGAVTF